MDSEQLDLWGTLHLAHSVDEKPYYTMYEVARLLDVSFSTVGRWITRNEMQSTKLGPKKRIILRAQLRKWIDEIERGGSAWK